MLTRANIYYLLLFKSLNKAITIYSKHISIDTKTNLYGEYIYANSHITNNIIKYKQARNKFFILL